MSAMTTIGDHVSTTTATSGLTTPRRAGLAGIVAGFLFPSMIVITTALEWDYMHDQWGWSLTGGGDVPYPSGLATGPYGFLQIANFAVTGLLVLVFGQGLVDTLRPGASRVVARVGFAVMGVALVTSAFPTDFFYRIHGSPLPTSWHGWIHGISFFALMLSMLVATIAFAVNARSSSVWRGWALPTLAVPLLLVVALAGLVPNSWAFYLLILVWFGWIGLAGARLRTLA